MPISGWFMASLVAVSSAPAQVGAAWNALVPMQPGGAARTCPSAAAGSECVQQSGQRTRAGGRAWHGYMC